MSAYVVVRMKLVCGCTQPHDELASSVDDVELIPYERILLLVFVASGHFPLTQNWTLALQSYGKDFLAGTCDYREDFVSVSSSISFALSF